MQTAARSLARWLAPDVCLSSPPHCRRAKTERATVTAIWAGQSGPRSSEWQTGFSILVTSLLPMFIYFRIKSTAMKPPSAVQSTINYLFHLQYSLQATEKLPDIYYRVFGEEETGNSAGWALGCGMKVGIKKILISYYCYYYYYYRETSAEYYLLFDVVCGGAVG